jgi:DNA-binding response OmpR family regulator
VDDHRCVARILLVEDDASLRDALGMALRSHGHAVEAVDSGEAGLVALADSADSPATDLVVLDVMLPGIDGVETARRIRAGSSVPILMLTARDSDLDIVVGLEAGADDYVVKPVEPRVLDARIKALLRRTERGSAPVADGAEQWGELAISRDTLIVARSGQPVDLSPTELRLLLVLTSAPGRVFSRLQLLEQVWEQDYLGDSRLVDATVQRLRAKVETDPGAPRFIQTVRGFGYRFGPL